MSEKRNSIAINVNEYTVKLVICNNSLISEIPYIYMFININYTVVYWARFYQKDNQYILIEKETAYDGIKLDQFTQRNTKFKNLLKEAHIIELIEEVLCLNNNILLQLI